MPAMNKHLLNLWKDLIKNPSIKSGEAFEDDVADSFFPDNLYEMLHRSHDVNTNAKRYIRSSLWPDFQFEIRNTNVQFWVECKHRENNSDSSKIDIFKPGQLDRYKSHFNTFLMLCTYRHEEQYFYFVPMWHIKFNDLFISFLKPYEVIYDPPILPGLVKKYLSARH
jgi:hypothetical protein